MFIIIGSCPCVVHEQNNVMKILSLDVYFTIKKRFFKSHETAIYSTLTAIICLHNYKKRSNIKHAARGVTQCKYRLPLHELSVGHS